MVQNNYEEISNRILNALLVTGLIVAAVGFCVDISDTLKYAGTDLRNRVVGARCLLLGLDPYHHKGRPGDSELLLDPFDYHPEGTVSQVAVPPTVLIVHSVIANLPYKIQRQIWFILQWALLLASIGIFAKSTESKIKSKLIMIIGLLFISGSYFWRLHVERGQIYVLYVFLLAVSYWLSQRTFKNSALASCFMIGLTASLRPPVVFMSIPLLIYRKWKLFISTFAGLLCGFTMSLFVVDTGMWKNYFSAVRIIGKVHSGLIRPINIRYLQSHIVDGIDISKAISSITFYDSSIREVFRLLLGLRLSESMLAVLLILTILAMSILVYRIRVKNVSFSIIFLVGIVFAFISEFFIPAWCYSYNNVLWLIPLSLIIFNCEPVGSLVNPLIILPLAGLFFSISFVELQSKINLSSDLLIAAYSLTMTLYILRRNKGEASSSAALQEPGH